MARDGQRKKPQRSLQEKRAAKQEKRADRASSERKRDQLSRTSLT